MYTRAYRASARTHVRARTHSDARGDESNPTVIPLWNVARIIMRKSVVYDRSTVVGSNVRVHH